MVDGRQEKQGELCAEGISPHLPSVCEDLRYKDWRPDITLESICTDEVIARMKLRKNLSGFIQSKRYFNAVCFFCASKGGVVNAGGHQQSAGKKDP